MRRIRHIYYRSRHVSPCRSYVYAGHYRQQRRYLHVPLVEWDVKYRIVIIWNYYERLPMEAAVNRWARHMRPIRPAAIRVHYQAFLPDAWKITIRENRRYGTYTVSVNTGDGTYTAGKTPAIIPFDGILL